MFLILTPYQICNLYTFSPIVCVALPLLIVSWYTKAFNFNVVQIVCASVITSGKLLPNSISFSFYIFSKSFIGLGLMFRSLIRFKVLVVDGIGCRWCKWLYHFALVCAVVSELFVEKTILPSIEWSRHPCWPLSWLLSWSQMYEVISRLTSIPWIRTSVSTPVLYCFDCCSFTVWFEIRQCEISNFALLL